MIVAAVLLEVFGWTWIDPVVGAAIGLWILPRTWRLGSQAVRILLQAAPPRSISAPSAPTWPVFPA